MHHSNKRQILSYDSDLNALRRAQPVGHSMQCNAMHNLLLSKWNDEMNIEFRASMALNLQYTPEHKLPPNFFG